jgi:hypothetical protein
MLVVSKQSECSYSSVGIADSVILSYLSRVTMCNNVSVVLSVEVIARDAVSYRENVAVTPRYTGDISSVCIIPKAPDQSALCTSTFLLY